MKKSILFTMMLSLSLFLGNNIFGAGAGDDNSWTLSKSAGNVDLYYKLGTCNSEKVIFLKFDNKNDYNVKITWKEAVTDNNSGKVFEGLYGEKQLVLQPGITSKENCGEIGSAECVVYMKVIVPTFPADPKSFEFNEVSVVEAAR